MRQGPSCLQQHYVRGRARRRRATQRSAPRSVTMRPGQSDGRLPLPGCCFDGAGMLGSSSACNSNAAVYRVWGRGQRDQFTALSGGRPIGRRGAVPSHCTGGGRKGRASLSEVDNRALTLQNLSCAHNLQYSSTRVDTCRDRCWISFWARKN